MRPRGLGSATPRRLSGCAGRVRPESATARKQGSRGARKLDPHRDFLLGLIEATPDLTISELLERLLAERGVKVVARPCGRFSTAAV